MKVNYMCIYLLMRKSQNIYLLSLENKMKTPYRKLTIKTGVNKFAIFDVLFIVIKILRQKSWKSRCKWVADSSRIGIFHRKSTQSKIKWFSSVTFIFLNQSFGLNFNVKHKHFVQLVKMFASFVWFISFPSFGSFLLFAMFLSCVMFLLYVCIVSIIHLISLLSIV